MAHMVQKKIINLLQLNMSLRYYYSLGYGAIDVPFTFQVFSIVVVRGSQMDPVVILCCLQGLSHSTNAM